MALVLNLNDALTLILEDIHSRVPAFRNMRADKILITAGQARKKSRATTRPYSFAQTGTRRSETGKLYKPIVTYKKKRVRYEITLRPLFFMRSTPRQRLKTLFHELYHFSPAFDGTLDPTRRHDVLPRKAFDQQLEPLLKAYARVRPKFVLDYLAFDGQVELLQWLERPPHRYRPGQAVKRRYTERDLFLGPVLMRTAKKTLVARGH